MLGPREVVRAGAYMLGPAVAMGIMSVFTIWVLPLAATFHVPISSVMLIYAATGILMSLGLPFVGKLLTAFAPWKVLVAGALFVAVGLLASSVLSGFLPFALTYSLAIGIGTSLCGPLTSKTIAFRRWTKDVGALGGMMMISMALGATIMPLLLSPALAEFGWRLAFRLAAGIVVVTVVPIAWFVLRPDPLCGRITAAPKGDAPKIRVAPTTFRLLIDGRFWIILVAIIPMTGVAMALAQNLAPLLGDLGVDARSAGYVLSAKAFASALGAFLVGRSADRMDPRIVLTAACVIIMVSLAALTMTSNILIVNVALIAIGLAGGGATPLTAVFLVRVYGPAAYAPVGGLFSLFLMPAMVAPAAAGWLRESTGSYQSVLLICIPIAATGALIIWLLKVKSQAAPTMPEIVAQPAT